MPETTHKNHIIMINGHSQSPLSPLRDDQSKAGGDQCLVQTNNTHVHNQVKKQQHSFRRKWRRWPSISQVAENNEQIMNLLNHRQTITKHPLERIDIKRQQQQHQQEEENSLAITSARPEYHHHHHHSIISRNIVKHKLQQAVCMIVISVLLINYCQLVCSLQTSQTGGGSGGGATSTPASSSSTSSSSPISSSTTTTQSTGTAEGSFVFQHSNLERDSDYWLQSGRQALEAALRVQPINQVAKNAILFIGDGMSLSTITAARILHGQLMNRSGEEDQLSFEQLSNLALIKTYNIDQQVPDSAATATAILTGVKTNFYTLGVNGNVRLNDTNCQRIQANHVNSILKQAQDAGKSTGIITNTRITHATPAAAYAHVSNRRWECDAYVPRNLEPPCKDIARQLIEDEPGSRLNVIMGGGRRCFFGQRNIDPGPTGQTGMRQDGRNLISAWIDRRKAQSDQNYAFVNSTENLRFINIARTEYLLGLFSYSHMSYEELRDTSGHGEPSLAEMTEVAIKILSKNPNGYLLLVEGGRIDHAHHENVAGVALRETVSLSWAVQTARNMIDQQDTLLAVTSDHAHALTINGIAPRGNPILGLSRYKEHSSQLPYTTLIYGNGPGHASPRQDPSEGSNSTGSPYYVQYAAIHQEEAFHDGSDVAIFASGPFAHLFQGVQEQSYIAHVFAYAMCIGNYQSAPHCRLDPLNASNNNNNNNNDEQAFGSSNTVASTFLPNNNNNYLNQNDRNGNSDDSAPVPVGRWANGGGGGARTRARSGNSSASSAKSTNIHLTGHMLLLVLAVGVYLAHLAHSSLGKVSLFKSST